MRVHTASGYFRRLEGGAANLDTVFEQCCRTTEVDTQCRLRSSLARAQATSASQPEVAGMTMHLLYARAGTAVFEMRAETTARRHAWELRDWHCQTSSVATVRR